MIRWFLQYFHRRLLVIDQNSNKYFSNFSSEPENLKVKKVQQEHYLKQKESFELLLKRNCDRVERSLVWYPFVTLMLPVFFWKIYNLAGLVDKSWKREIIDTLMQFGLAVLVIKYIFVLHCTPTGSAEPNILVGDRVFAWRCNYYFQPVRHGDLIIFTDSTFEYDQNWLKRLWQKQVGIAIPFLGLPEGPNFWVKRVIGLPGDKLEGKVVDGKTVVFRNDKELDEPYINPYPLIIVEYELGLFGKELGLPEILTRNKKIERIPYDPSLPFESQNFYQVSSQSVLKDEFDKPIMLHSRAPTRYGHRGKIVDNFGPFVVPEGNFWGMGDNRRGSYDSRGFGLVDFDLVVGRASRILWSLDSHEPWWFIEFFKNPVTFFTKKLRYSRFFRSLHPFLKVYPT